MAYGKAEQVGTSMEHTPQADPAPRPGLTRQQVVRGAVAGAGLLWVAPVVTGLGLTSAHADTTSGDDPNKKPVKVEGEQFTKTGGKLPFTGSSVPLGEAAVVGAGLVVAGGAAVAASRRRHRVATPAGVVLSEATENTDATEAQQPDGE